MQLAHDNKETFEAPTLRPLHPSDDGTERVEDEVIEVFINWLKDNGARFPKCVWPSRDTVGGVRGAIATETIETNEPIMWIPHKLLISPPVARSSSLIGHIFTDHERFFHGDDDLLLATYIMFEESRGSDSFWYPFLAMLPRPGSVSDWSADEMKELQDPVLVEDAKRRPARLLAKYEKLMTLLESEYFDLFDRKVHTYDRFRHAWMTIQARAFGRRLPWTALVPFADCLNHTNVQTKYDFNVDGNGFFRLFPTGSNRYPVGTEVFNSYGRRDNRFLLMEYGFALFNNEWDTVDLVVEISETDEAAERKRGVLRRFYISSRRQFKLRTQRLNTDLLGFCRLRTMSSEDLDDPDNEIKFFGQGISLTNEVAALNLYMSILENKLASYTTTFEEDEVILGQGFDVLGPRLICATRYRHSKKAVVLAHMENIRGVLPLVEFMLSQEKKFDDYDKPKVRAPRVNVMRKYLLSVLSMADVPPEPLSSSEDNDNSESMHPEALRPKVNLVPGRSVTSHDRNVEEKSNVTNSEAPVTTVDGPSGGDASSGMLDLEQVNVNPNNGDRAGDGEKEERVLLRTSTSCE